MTAIISELIDMLKEAISASAISGDRKRYMLKRIQDIQGSTAVNQMYTILRQLCDPEYAGPEPPTQQDMMDAIAAYEIEQKMSGEAGNVPPSTTITPLFVALKVNRYANNMIHNMAKGEHCSATDAAHQTISETNKLIKLIAMKTSA